MHSILFAVKRTFHKSVWFGRYLLRDYLLTPSRFDILYILKTHEPLTRLWQSRIREILGIAGPTLSRMIKALLECPSTTLREIDELETTLLRMRERLCDQATLYYPWHPDHWRTLLTAA